MGTRTRVYTRTRVHTGGQIFRFERAQSYISSHRSYLARLEHEAVARVHLLLGVRVHKVSPALGALHAGDGGQVALLDANAGPDLMISQSQVAKIGLDSTTAKGGIGAHVHTHKRVAVRERSDTILERRGDRGCLRARENKHWWARARTASGLASRATTA